MLTGGSRTAGTSAIALIINCSNNVTIGGTSAGIFSGSLKLYDSLNSAVPVLTLSLSDAQSWVFNYKYPQGTKYNIAIQTQPPNLYCSVNDPNQPKTVGSYPVTGANNISSITIICGYKLSATVSGLAAGSTLLLTNTRNQDTLSLTS